MKGDRQTQLHALPDESVRWFLQFAKKRSLKLAGSETQGTRSARFHQHVIGEYDSQAFSEYEQIVAFVSEIPELEIDLYSLGKDYVLLSVGTFKEELLESAVFSRSIHARPSLHGVHAFFRSRLLRGAWLGNEKEREFYSAKLYSEGVRRFIESGGLARQLKGRGPYLMLDTPPKAATGRIIECFEAGSWRRRC